jgi:D-alanyl-D-alanine carboxypeptidase
VLTVTVACGEERATARPDLNSALRAAVQRDRAAARIPGVAVAVALADGRTLTVNAGVADRSTRRPVTDDTLFAIGSVTKPFTAALLLRLAERGALRLDDPMRRWVPRFRWADGITVRNLLAMRSGLPNFTDDPDWRAAQDRSAGKAWTPARTLRYTGPPTAPPGQRWDYSNTNYVLAGLVAERAAGMDYARALRREVLDPRAFPRTVVQPEEHPAGSVAVGYRAGVPGVPMRHTPNDGYVPSETIASTAWSAGGMLASAHDLARAAQRLFRGDGLSPAARTAMTRFTDTGHDPPPQYGLGLARDTLAGQEVWMHGGDIDGFHADLAYLPGRGTTIAALTNLEASSPGREAMIEHLVAILGGGHYTQTSRRRTS